MCLRHPGYWRLRGSDSPLVLLLAYSEICCYLMVGSVKGEAAHSLRSQYFLLVEVAWRLYRGIGSAFVLVVLTRVVGYGMSLTEAAGTTFAYCFSHSVSEGVGSLLEREVETVLEEEENTGSIAAGSLAKVEEVEDKTAELQDVSLYRVATTTTGEAHEAGNSYSQEEL